MSDDLKADLTDIRGVGEATADSILDVLDDHDAGGSSALLEKAIAAAADGDDRRAAIYLRRANR